MTSLAGAAVEVDRRTRVHAGADGGLLVGGSPLQVLRLGAPALAAVQAWRAGAPVGGPAEQRLARRLHDCGALVVRPATTTWASSDVTVVVPVRDRAEQLDRCLARLRGCAVVVVDDASVDPDGIAAVAARHGARLLRREVNGGPAAARNTGLAEIGTALVAFVDSDVELPPGALEALLPSVLEGVAVVAPRVVGAGGAGALARYETENGPLDLGTDAGPVRHGARTGYLPAAVLLCRTDAVRAGFDETLRWGEDVDLVWRLHADGWTVRYEPGVVAGHATRGGFGAWWRQRYGYGRSAALLDLRHPGEVAPAAVSRTALPVLLALLARRPGAAAAVAVAGAARLAARLPAGPGRAVEPVRLVAAGAGWSAVSLLEAVARPWLPVAVLLVARPQGRRLVVIAVAVRLLRARRGARCGLPPAVWVGLRLLDDLAYGTGVWAGALRHRRPRALLPRLR